jgi:hypothetical protein
MDTKSSLTELVEAALGDEGIPVDDRSLRDKLQDLALDFKIAAGNTGGKYERTAAVVLAALEWLAGRPNDPALSALEKAAEGYFRREPDWHPFTATAKAGSNHLLDVLREERKHGRTNEEIAIVVISEAPKARPGLPAIAEYYRLPEDKRKGYANQLRLDLTAAFDQVDRREKLDPEDWPVFAGRAALRVLGDADPDNAFKHLMTRK